MRVKIAYEFDHEAGTHIVVRNVKAPYRRLTVHDHKEISEGKLRSIIREARLSLEGLNNLHALK